MARVTFNDNQLTAPAWAGDFFNREHLVPGGAKLVAAEFLATDATVVTLGAAGAIGATSLTVAALTNPIPSGTLLDFGAWSVLVTVNDASITAGDTSITVLALPGALPAGAVLNFATGTNAQLVELSAAAAAGATAITVLPVDGTVADEATATYSRRKLVRTAALAAAAATSITVTALDVPLVSGDVATYTGSGSQLSTVIAGTPVGRTWAERAAGTGFGPAVAADEETYLVAFDVTDVATNNDVELYRHGSIVKENMLPNFSTLDSGVLADIRANYQTTRGAA